MASPTPNKGFTYPAHGGAVNSWDSPLNTNFDQIDAILGNSYNIVLASSIVGVVFNSSYCTAGTTVSEIVLTTSVAQQLYFNVTGNSVGNTGGYTSIDFPAGVGQFCIINNQTTGGGLNARSLGSGTYTALDNSVHLVVTDAVRAWDVKPATATVIPAGSAFILGQAAAPSGWTLANPGSDRMLRMNGTGGGTGGSWTVSGLSVGNHTLTVAEIPAHGHSYNTHAVTDAGNYAGGGSKTADTGNTGLNTGNTGGGGGHNHPISQDGSWRPLYYDVIRCTKN